MARVFDLFHGEHNVIHKYIMMSPGSGPQRHTTDDQFQGPADMKGQPRAMERGE